jgi:hypothetical protein
MEIRKFAEKYIKAEKQAFKEGNFNALEAIVSPNVVYHWGSFRDMVGHEAHKQDIVNYRKFTSKHTQEWDYVIGDGDVCVLSIKETMTFIDEYPAISAPVGATIEFDGVFILRRDNEKMVEAWIKGNSRIL